MEREEIFKNGKLQRGAIFGYPERRESWTNNRGRDERETCRAAPSVDLRDNDQEMTGGSATITEMVTRGNQVNWQIAIDRPLTAQGTAQTTSKISLRFHRNSIPTPFLASRGKFQKRRVEEDSRKSTHLSSLSQRTFHRRDGKRSRNGVARRACPHSAWICARITTEDGHGQRSLRSSEKIDEKYDTCFETVSSFDHSSPFLKFLEKIHCKLRSHHSRNRLKN